jgi:hypothetical protein
VCRSGGCSLEALADDAQGFITDAMAVGVVHPLEAIEIGHQDGEHLAVAGSFAHSVVEAIGEAGAVVEPSQSVGVGKTGQLLLGALLRANIPRMHKYDGIIVRPDVLKAEFHTIGRIAPAPGAAEPHRGPGGFFEQRAQPRGIAIDQQPCERQADQRTLRLELRVEAALAKRIRPCRRIASGMARLCATAAANS